VTGGAGFMGINLVRHLLDRGHAVRSYDIAPFVYPEAGRIDVIRGDIRDRGLHDRAFRDIDVVVHCAAALPLADPSLHPASANSATAPLPTCPIIANHSHCVRCTRTKPAANPGTSRLAQALSGSRKRRQRRRSVSDGGSPKRAR
jgi:dTDP-D-glucose 4,6-dehydratase